MHVFMLHCRFTSTVYTKYANLGHSSVPSMVVLLLRTLVFNLSDSRLGLDPDPSRENELRAVSQRVVPSPD